MTPKIYWFIIDINEHKDGTQKVTFLYSMGWECDKEGARYRGLWLTLYLPLSNVEAHRAKAFKAYRFRVEERSATNPR